MKFENFLPETKRVAIDFGGDKLNVEYRPGAIVVVSDDEFDDQDRNVLAQRICDVVESWDAEGPLPYREINGKAIGSLVSEGELIPLDPDIVQYIPVPALVGILSELNADAIPDPKGTRKRSRRRG